MFFNIAITRSWMISRKAQRVYGWCAIGAAVLFLWQLLLLIILGFRMSELASLMLLAGIPFLLASSLLYVAMLYFWLTVDIRQRGPGPLCALLPLLLGWFGAAIYYLVRYRPLARRLEGAASLLTFSHGAGL